MGWWLLGSLCSPFLKIGATSTSSQPFGIAAVAMNFLKGITTNVSNFYEDLVVFIFHCGAISAINTMYFSFKKYTTKLGCIKFHQPYIWPTSNYIYIYLQQMGVITTRDIPVN